MSYVSIAEKLAAHVSEDGEIENDMSTLLFSSFNDPNVWSPIDIDCPMPKSSFYIARLNLKLSPFIVNDDKDDEEDIVYTIVRHTKDDITQYLDYLKLEFHSYLNMEEQTNEAIMPIGYRKCISQEGFLFAFLTSTNTTLGEAIDGIKDLPLQTRFSFVINLISIVNEAFINENVTGFHITPKTILINFQSDEESIGLIGYVGEMKNLKLCPTALQFMYNDEYSPTELKRKIKPSIRAPNSISDVYGLARIVQLIIGDELQIPEYKKVMLSALQKSQSNRLPLNDFKNQMLEIQKEVSILEETPLHSSTKTPPEEEKAEAQPPKIPKIRLVDKIKDFCTLSKTEEGCPQVYKLPKQITKSYSQQKLEKITIGQQTNEVKDEVKILIVGQTGSGKTTFLNGISNYLYGVEWEDNCRFKIVSDEDEGQRTQDKYEGQRTQYKYEGQRTQDKDEGKDPTESQTDHVTAYTFPWQPGFPVPYTVTIIDTPGFGDTRGMERDKQIVDQLESLFKNQNNCGVDSLNAVAFVVQSALPRLNASQQYVFDSIMKLFGKDIANNFIIIATFADAGDPQVLAAVKKAKIPTTYVSKFNNSALFARLDGDNVIMNKLFWEIGQTGYASVFASIGKMQPRSLSLTQNVLDERKKLHVSIDGLSRGVRDGIAKMNEIETECRIIEQFKREIQANKNFKTKVKVFKCKKTDLERGQYVTNCSHCNKTCHYPCYIPNDCDKHGCAAMNNKGYCNVCGCHWNMHFNMSFRWETYEVEEERTLEELKQKWGDAKSKKQNRKKMLENAQNEYKKIWDSTSQLLNQCKNCVVRLQQIALRPIALSEIDYIKLQIEGEKQRCEPGWQVRVKWLEELLEQQKLIEAISKGNEKSIMPHQKVQIKNQRIKDFFTKVIGFQF